MSGNNITGKESFDKTWSFRERLIWYEKKRLLEQRNIEPPALRETPFCYLEDFERRRTIAEISNDKREKGDDYYQLADISKDTLFNEETAFVKRPRNKLQAPVTKVRMRKICFLLNVNPEHFLLSEEDEDLWFNDTNKARHLFFTRKYWNTLKALTAQISIWDDIHIFKHHNPTQNEELKRAYEKVAPFLKSATRKIVVHELLFKGDYHSPELFKIHNIAQKITYDAIFEALENHKRNKKSFRYRRTFFLSGSNRLFIKGNRGQWLQAFVAEASYETLVHVIECLRQHNVCCKFAVVGDRHSLRHRAVIDDRYFLFEDYKYKEGTTTPESLCFIDLKSKKEGNIILDFMNTTFPKRSLIKIDDVRDIRNALDEAMLTCIQEARSRMELIEFLNRKDVEEGLSKMNDNKKGKKVNPPDFSKLKGRIKATQKMYSRQAKSIAKKYSRLRSNKYLT